MSAPLLHHLSGLDCDVSITLDRFYWSCPEEHPKLTIHQARSETKKQMIHVAYENI
jgi:hypothetical protein